MKTNRFLESLEYEEFVRMSYDALVSEDVGAVFLKRAYLGKRTGHQHEIDVSIELMVADLRIIILVECKHYRNKVEISDLLEFAQRLEDIGAHKGVMVTTIGFQEGALRVAEGHGIALVTTVPCWQMIMACTDHVESGTTERTKTSKESANEVDAHHDTITRIRDFDLRPMEQREFSEVWRSLVRDLNYQVIEHLFESGKLRIELECPSCHKTLQASDFRQCPRCFTSIEEATFGDSTWYKCVCAKMIHISDLNAVRCQCGKVLSKARVEIMRHAKMYDLLVT
jgi:hypothetical protein